MRGYGHEGLASVARQAGWRHDVDAYLPYPGGPVSHLVGGRDLKSVAVQTVSDEVAVGVVRDTVGQTSDEQFGGRGCSVGATVIGWLVDTDCVCSDLNGEAVLAQVAHLDPPWRGHETTRSADGLRRADERRIRQVREWSKVLVTIGACARERVISLIRRQLLIDTSTIEVDVLDGVVTLRGQLDSRVMFEPLVDVIRDTTGVVAVHDNIGYRLDQAP